MLLIHYLSRNHLICTIIRKGVEVSAKIIKLKLKGAKVVLQGFGIPQVWRIDEVC